MNNQQILNDRPKNAIVIMFFDGFYRWGFADGTYSECIDDVESKYTEIIRSLTDIERIVELEAQTQWVSVEDRLPDEKRDYLVYTPKSTYYKIGSNAWHGKLGWATAKNVTHWMPLPTPPSGGDL